MDHTCLLHGRYYCLYVGRFVPRIHLLSQEDTEVCSNFLHLFTFLDSLKLHRNFAMAASMFMNLNSLPIALMQSLVVMVNGLKMTADDTSDSMLGCLPII